MTEAELSVSIVAGSDDVHENSRLERRYAEVAARKGARPPRHAQKGKSHGFDHS
jgi:hypothetical protein